MTVAVSEMGLPRAAEGVAVVVMTPSTMIGTDASPGALHGLETGR